MVVFVAALFTPNTIGFNPSRSSSTATTISVSEKDEKDHLATSNGHQPNQHCRSQSLTQPPTFAEFVTITPKNLIQTPGATTFTETIFKPLNNTQYKLKLPEKGALIRNKSSNSLASLTALDAQVVPWGKNDQINQPKSLAESPPSQSIFNESQLVVDTYRSPPIFAKSPQKSQSSAGSNDKGTDFTTSNYTVEKSNLGNAGLISAVEAATSDTDASDIVWVGTLGMPTDVLSVEVKKDISHKLELHHNTLAVFTADTDINAHYENYCKQILWPLFHSQIPAVPKSKAYQDNSWDHYVRVNEAFAAIISENYKKGDKLLINDYHLMLVPSLVREKHPDAQIGLFMHSTFPPFEIYRTLPARKQLISGILGANMIAFQTPEYKYQFLQTCSRLMTIEATEHGLVLENGRFIDVFDIPMGIDIDDMKGRRQISEVKDWMKELSEKFAGKRIIMSRDKLDTVHGLSHKLRAFRALLEEHPEWQDKVVLVQIATSTNSNEELQNSINSNITSINSEWGSLSHQPVMYLNRDIDFAQYMALLAIADCMLVTSVSDGMNLTCHEFIVSQDKELSMKGHATLVISERIGAATLFEDHALLINPFHIKGVADELHRALMMKPEEREKRWKAMYAITEANNARAWFDTYMSRLKHAWTEHSTRDSKSVPRLQVKQLRQQYDASQRRLLIIDFEGTLIEWDSPKETVITIPLRVLDMLRNLVDDERNIIYVMAQQPMDTLEHMFRSTPKIGLIAENGAYIRRYGMTDWRMVTAFDTESWKRGVMSYLESAQRNIPGSFIRQLDSGIIFHYDDAEDERNAMEQAGALANTINEASDESEVSAVPFNKGLYIHPTKIDRGLAMKTIEAHHIKPVDQRIDFLFAVGNSNEDEPVFRWSQTLDMFVDESKVFTCAVGHRNTAAKTAIQQGVNAVLLTLEKLAAHEIPQAA